MPALPRLTPGSRDAQLLQAEMHNKWQEMMQAMHYMLPISALAGCLASGKPSQLQHM